MTWKEFKLALTAKGIKDHDNISWIDVNFQEPNGVITVIRDDDDQSYVEINYERRL